MVDRDDVDGLEEVDDEHEGDGDGGRDRRPAAPVVAVVVCILLNRRVSKNSARDPPLQYSF